MIAPMTETTIVLMSSAPWMGSSDTEQQRGEEPAHEGADDAEHDVADHAVAFVALDEEPGKIAGNCSENEPGDDVHPKPPSLFVPLGT